MSFILYICSHKLTDPVEIKSTEKVSGQFYPFSNPIELVFTENEDNHLTNLEPHASLFSDKKLHMLTYLSIIAQFEMKI